MLTHTNVSEQPHEVSLSVKSCLSLICAFDHFDRYTFTIGMPTRNSATSVAAQDQVLHLEDKVLKPSRIAPDEDHKHEAEDIEDSDDVKKCRRVEYCSVDVSDGGIVAGADYWIRISSQLAGGVLKRITDANNTSKCLSWMKDGKYDNCDEAADVDFGDHGEDLWLKLMMGLLYRVVWV